MGAISGGGLSLGTLSIAIEAAVDQALSDIQNFGTTVGGILDEQKQKWQGLADVGQSLTSLGTALSGISVAALALGGVSVKAAADMESLSLGLKAVEGSADAAATRLASLREISKMPGLALPEAVEAYTRLRAVGTSATDAETYLKAFGNALATVGKGAPDLEAVVTQLTQMSAKTQVVAGDLKPIMERVPQVAAIIKEAYGTIDTEKLQKAGVDTKEFIGVMVAGLQQLQPFAGGLANSFENLKDASTKALGEIGAAFAPLVTSAIPILESLLGWVGQAATAFANLPQPVQTFVLALGAITIAIGPLLLLAGQFAIALAALAPLITGITAALGISAVALGGWVIAIAAAVAGLVALGAWVYQNWDAIVAGIAAGLAFIVGKIIEFVNKAADLPLVGSAFKAVGKGLEPLQSSLEDTAKKHAAAAEASKKHAADEKAAADAASQKEKAKWEALKGTLTNVSDQHDKTGKSADKLKGHVKDAGDAAGDAEDKFKKLQNRNEILDAIAQQLSSTHHKLAAEIAAALLSAGTLATQLENGLGPAIGALNLGSTAWLNTFTDLGKNGLPKVIEKIGDIKPVIDPAIGSIASMNQGLSALGITSSATFTQLADDAQKAYAKVIAAPDATQWEKDSAFLKLLEAQKKAVLAAGEDFPAATEKMMADIKTKVEGKAPDINTAFGDMTKGVSTVITNFAQDISKSLWEGDDSWGEKGKKLLTSLGEAVTSSFLEPAAKAIGNLISGALKSLLSGDGLGGVLDSIKNIGTSLTNVFSGGTSAASGAGGAASGAGGAGGAASGGMGAALGWANLGVSVVNGIVSFFQGSEENKTLDKVVLHTLQTANDLANLRVDDWDRFGQFATWKDDILNALGRIQGDTGISRISLQETEHHCWQASATLGDMLSDMRGGAPAAATFMEDVVNLLAAMVGKLDGIAGGSMTMNLNGTDPVAVGGIIAGRLRRQGAFG